MKKCPYCAEEIQEDAQKCKHCQEYLNKKTLATRSIFKSYEKWLKQNYPAYNIVSKDEEEKTIILNKQYNSFSGILFLLLLLLWILPGLIYAAMTFKDKIITLTIYFDNKEQAIKINNPKFEFLIEKYNNNISK